jgi:hypothetical protein
MKQTKVKGYIFCHILEATKLKYAFNHGRIIVNQETGSSLGG